MNLPELPNLDDPCGRYFSFRDFVECGATWQSTRTDNIPTQLDTYLSLSRLTAGVLDPVIEKFGPINLTYGLACGALTKHIEGRISPRVDQHAAHELSATGKRICDRGGAACDFRIDAIDSLSLAQWLVGNTAFDRLYYYGRDRPIHVSAAVDAKGQIVLVQRDAGSGRALPTVISTEKFLALQ